MNGIDTSNPGHPDAVVTRDGVTHIPDGRLKAARTREDCRRCSLDDDVGGCLQAKCRRNIYKALPKEIIRI